MIEKRERRLGGSPTGFDSIEIGGHLYPNSEFGFVGTFPIDGACLFVFKMIKACTVIHQDSDPKPEDFDAITVNQYILTENGIWYFDCLEKRLVNLLMYSDYMRASLLSKTNAIGIPFERLTDQEKINKMSKYTNHHHFFDQKGKYLLLPEAETQEGWEQEYRHSLKNKLDALKALDFRIQDYQFIRATCQTATGAIPMTVILADGFEATCQKNPLVVFNTRESFETDYGLAFKAGRGYGRYDFTNILERSNDRAFVQVMFEQLIKEYAITYIFDLSVSKCQRMPIAFELGYGSERQQIQAELPPNFPSVVSEIISQYHGDIPRARYMLWDLTEGRPQPSYLKNNYNYISDFILRPSKRIATLADFESFKGNGIVHLVNLVAISITHFIHLRDGRGRLMAPYDEYNITLISIDSFDELDTELEKKPYLIKNAQGEYHIWGYKKVGNDYDWRFTDIGHLEIDFAWKEYDSVFISSQHNLFETLNKGHSPSAYEVGGVLAKNFKTAIDDAYLKKVLRCAAAQVEAWTGRANIAPIAYDLSIEEHKDEVVKAPKAGLAPRIKMAGPRPSLHSRHFDETTLAPRVPIGHDSLFLAQSRLHNQLCMEINAQFNCDLQFDVGQIELLSHINAALRKKDYSMAYALAKQARDTDVMAIILKYQAIFAIDLDKQLNRSQSFCSLM